MGKAPKDFSKGAFRGWLGLPVRLKSFVSMGRLDLLRL